jgi:16S rRNA (cytosine967-C5)-methyltransferase
VLVDAPCTGLGTIHRRPEILLRVRAEDPARMAELQRAILRNAAKLVRRGGRIVYAVCSPMREEGAGVVQRAVEEGVVAHDEAPLALGGVARDRDGLVRLGPWSAPSGDGPDAYVVALLRKT